MGGISSTHPENFSSRSTSLAMIWGRRRERMCICKKDVGEADWKQIGGVGGGGRGEL